MNQSAQASIGDFNYATVWARSGSESPGPREAAFDWSELEQHRGGLTRFAIWTLRDPASAEDAVQETLLAALQSGKRFAGRSSVKTWLFGILKHKIADTFRRQAHEQQLDDDVLGWLDDPADLFNADGRYRAPVSHWNDPEAALTQHRFMEVLQSCIDRLPQKAAQVFTMRELLDMETTDICRAAGISESNCHVLLFRARLTLRRLLEESWFGGEVAATSN